MQYLFITDNILRLEFYFVLKYFYQPSDICCFHPSTLHLDMLVYLIVSLSPSGQFMAGFCFVIYSDSFFLLPGMFNSLPFSPTINKTGFKCAILVFLANLSYLLLSFLFLSFGLMYFLIFHFNSSICFALGFFMAASR